MSNDIEVKCSACGEVSFKSQWRKAGIEVVNGRKTFVGGCPHCKGEFYDEIKK